MFRERCKPGADAPSMEQNECRRAQVFDPTLDPTYQIPRVLPVPRGYVNYYDVYLGDTHSLGGH